MRVKLNKDGFNAHHRQDPDSINIHDRINQAYRGELGEAFQQKTKRRVDWVVSKVIGPRVLDVGCSQGIVPILLGRKGIDVTGVDIDNDVVVDANKDLASESKKVQRNVSFICDDFLKYKPDTKAFDSVIFSEFLEHLYEPEKFIEQAFRVTRVGGRIIITVPFGINDYPDHRQNFYLMEMYSMVSQYYVITSVEIMTKWIAFVGERKAKKTKPEYPDQSLFHDAEAAFYEIERDLVDRLYDLTDQVRTLEQSEKVLRDSTAHTWEKLKSLEKSHSATVGSTSFKVGRVITSLPRRARRIIKKGKS